MADEVPHSLTNLKNFIRNDVRRMLALGNGGPNYGVVLLIVIASESLGTFLGRSEDSVFVEELLGGRGVPKVVGRCLFDAVRNGLAHSYETKDIMVDGGPVAVVISWKTLPHLSVMTKDWGDGRERPGVCLNVQTLWADLDNYLEGIEVRLREDDKFRHEVDHRMRSLDTLVRPQGEAVEAWRTFLRDQLIAG